MDKKKNNSGCRPVFYEQYSQRSRYRILATYRKNKEREQSRAVENVIQNDDNARYHSLNK